MKKLAIKELFYVILTVSIIAISFYLIKSGDDEQDLSSLFVKNLTLGEVKKNNEIVVIEKEIPPTRLSPSMYAKIHKEETEKQIQKRKENKQNDKENQESSEANQETNINRHDDGSGVKKTMEVTMYTAGVESTGKSPSHPRYGITASGNKVKKNRTIACPKRLDFGTEVYIPHFDNTYVCEDRGGAITVGHIDVYVKRLDKAINFGRRNLDVIIYQ